MQTPTQVYGRRPYGVGILIAGYDVSGKYLKKTENKNLPFNYKTRHFPPKKWEEKSSLYPIIRSVVSPRGHSN